MHSITLIPDPTGSDVQTARYQHADLGGLSTRELWAERTIIRNELARRIFYRPRRPRGDHELAWLDEREKRLTAELRRRGRR